MSNLREEFSCLDYCGGEVKAFKEAIFAAKDHETLKELTKELGKADFPLESFVNLFNLITRREDELHGERRGLFANSDYYFVVIGNGCAMMLPYEELIEADIKRYRVEGSFFVPKKAGVAS